MQPPAQELVARDLHDNLWTFRHIYRGWFILSPIKPRAYLVRLMNFFCLLFLHFWAIPSQTYYMIMVFHDAGQPKRHLLTTGWSLFVSGKRLFAGDSVLFIRYFFYQQNIYQVVQWQYSPSSLFVCLCLADMPFNRVNKEVLVDKVSKII